MRYHDTVMRHAGISLVAVALVLAGAGCLPSGPVIPSVQRIPFPTPTVPVDTNAGPQPVLSPTEEELAYPSGVRGSVLLRTTCPPQQPEGCGDRPFEADLRIATKQGTFVKKFRSAKNGEFAVSLLPGTYVIGQPTGAPAFPNAQDQEFTVVEDRWTDVVVRFDPGGGR